ncbi:RNA polymerase sigma factor [Microbispora bryophytorum]|uniref:Sigma-70 family RNA polymerase sigma factor n=1 Tax=Microbispora bryophytorum TaxID=1460882 RepID=A0A8H9H5K7_9ACTN|nr:RNA polymerase sigma factor [Microbispora bryophytorum]MBD3140830.1 hypothetical protein [Microbispora bryophytorum]TQS00664.1 hypothetical protein FLX07_33010 [Microbispora bryophytorum]GGO31146.1 hypothetical protein GCM10011574_68430 [Microbispora bryophytorum]
MNDGVLVEALRARDPGALAALYDTYAGNLYRYCRTLLAGPDAAQVALRDTLIAAEALVGSLADPDRFRPWLYALARGECMRRRTPEETGPDAGPDTGPIPLATVPFPGVAAEGAEADLRLVASSAVGTLSVEDREVLELAARHGMSGQDLAAVLGAGERYAEALLDAATERLRETVTVEILARRATHDCARASAILAEFTGELTPQARAQLSRHLARCETCAHQRVRQISPAKVFGLLPQIALPETLRVRVLSSFIDPELVPYRRYVAKRIGGLNAAGFPRAGRREGRLAQAVAGAVAALAAVATIALVFAQFAGDLRERAADTIAPLRLPTAEASAGVSGGAASPEGSSDEAAGADEAGGRSPAPPVSRELAEPVVPVVPARPVPVPRPAPLPAPVPPADRPHRPVSHGKPPGHPAGGSSSQGPGASPSGPTPTPVTTSTPPGGSGTPSTPGGSGTPGWPGSGGPGSGGPGSGWPGSGGHGPGGPGSGGHGPGGPGPGWSPRGGPPPAHWPGHRPPWRDHQHHSRLHREWPPTPASFHKPSGGHGGHGGPTALPPGRGGHGGRHEAQSAGGGERTPSAGGSGRAPSTRDGGRTPSAGGSGGTRSTGDGERARRAGDGSGPGRSGRDGSLPGVPGGIRGGGSERGTERRGTSGGPATGPVTEGSATRGSATGGSGRPGGAFPGQTGRSTT